MYKSSLCKYIQKKLNTAHINRIKCEKTVSLNQQERIDRFINEYRLDGSRYRNSEH